MGALPTDVTVATARVRYEERRFRTPLVLSTGPIEAITQATAEVDVVNAEGRRATGQGSIYLSDLWAWPDPALTHAQRDASMRNLCETVATALPHHLNKPGHPLDHGVSLEHALQTGAFGPASYMSTLAALVCGSIFDAAIHDAYGRLYGIDAYAALAPKYLPRDLAHYLPHEPAAKGRHLSELIRATPHASLMAWHIVGKNDCLTRAEWKASGRTPVGDGLPDCVEDWIERLGVFCFKLKITGTDNAVDAARTAATYDAVRGVHDRLNSGRNVVLSIDSNEANPDAQSVIDYLERLRGLSPNAYEALRYIEQPTGRDLKKVNADMHQVAARKPVLVDEALTGLDLLPTVRAQGWSGLALKTCKGHSSALLCAAWCELLGMPYTLQDLTNPGIAWPHALSLGAHLNTLNGVELNAYQYTPAALGTDPLFQIRNGYHETGDLDDVGLSSAV